MRPLDRTTGCRRRRHARSSASRAGRATATPKLKRKTHPRLRSVVTLPRRRSREKVRRAGSTALLALPPDLAHTHANTGPVRERRPVYVDLLPPCNAGCPAGENIQAWLAHAQAGRHEQAWRAAGRRQPAAGDPRAGLLPPVRERLQPGRASTAPSRSTRSSGSSATSRWSRAGRSTRRRSRSGKRVLVIGAGPSGLSAAYHLARLGHEVEIRDAGAEPGGMMRYGIPAYRLPRDVLDGELEPDRGDGRADDLRPPGRGPRRRAARRAASTRSSSRSARTCPSGSTSPPGTPGRSSTRCRSCAASPRASGR